MDLNRIARVVSILSAVSGLLAIAVPGQVADFVGFVIEPGSGLGYGEIGAVYGGSFVALGVLGVWATRPGVSSGSVLLTAIGAVWAGFAGGRLLVMLLTAKAAAGVMGWTFLVLEALVAVLFVVAGQTASRRAAV